jgi:hypothetical protein
MINALEVRMLSVVGVFTVRSDRKLSTRVFGMNAFSPPIRFGLIDGCTAPDSSHRSVPVDRCSFPINGVIPGFGLCSLRDRTVVVLSNDLAGCRRSFFTVIES